MRVASTIVLRLLITIAASCLTGCPRFAYVSVFNNSGADVRIVVEGEDHGVLQVGMTMKFRFIGETFEVIHESKRWNYIRQIPHGGEDGPYFDGTLRVRLESDGRLYALKADQNAPVLHFDEQPAGFPLKPTEPNQSVQHNAGSRPSSGDSTASETPSSLGPRG